MGDEPLWLTYEDVVAIHRDQLRLFGGLPGVVDANLVHGAIAAPQNLFHYAGQGDLLVLAIKLCLSIAKDHGFADGNKRTATAAMIEFLAVNGYDLLIPDDEADTPILGQWVEKAVRGDLSADQLRNRLEPFIQDRLD